MRSTNNQTALQPPREPDRSPAPRPEVQQTHQQIIRLFHSWTPSDPLFKLPANPKTADEIVLDCDSSAPCDAECKKKDFKLGPQVSKGKKKSAPGAYSGKKADPSSGDDEDAEPAAAAADDDDHDYDDDEDDGGKRDVQKNAKASRIHTTTGTMWTHCNCGMTGLHHEMVPRESSTMVVEMLKNTFGNCETWPTIMAYDDMVRSSRIICVLMCLRAFIMVREINNSVITARSLLYNDLCTSAILHGSPRTA